MAKIAGFACKLHLALQTSSRWDPMQIFHTSILQNKSSRRQETLTFLYPKVFHQTSMKYHSLLLSVFASIAAGFSPSLPTAFLGKASPSETMLRDSESIQLEKYATSKFDLPKAGFQVKDLKLTVDQAEATHGMPWKKSIDTSYEGDELLYMPFWEWHMSFMKDNLSNLEVQPCHNGVSDFSYNENLKKKARITSLCLSSDEYRKIRLTYYDAGEGCQVYNAVFYPDPKYNLPVLGVDLLAFNRKKYLAIVDFQPIHEDEEDHAIEFESRLAPIKEKYDSLKGRMSSKFYDETQFFSKQMLFARFEDEKVIQNELFPAFRSYVKTHLDLIREVEADEEGSAAVLDRQREYDTYSASRDPATGLFAAMFGADWAEDFVHDFLFSMSERPDGSEVTPPAMPFMGGGGPPRGAAKSPVSP